MIEIVGIIFLSIGLLSLIISVLGIFKFSYMLDRIHSSAVCDTSASLFIIIGLGLVAGDIWLTIKLFLVLIFLWIASPISGNFIARVERMTNIFWKDRVGGKK